MRRKDREITDFAAALEIIDACQIIHIGLSDGDFPYIVPLNFAYTAEGEQLKFYIHGAKAGRKFELLTKNPVCSFELDLPVGLECIEEDRDATMRYKSVMGKCTVRFLEEEEKERIMDEVIMARYEETRTFAYNRSVLPRTAVMELTVTQWSAKANLKGAD